MIKDFHNISIRGRFAFGMRCLEKLADAQEGDHSLLKSLVFPKLWEFTSTDDLGEWEAEIRELDPVCVLEEEDSELKILYTKLPKEIVSTISDVIEIGTSNIYGGTKENAPLTLEALSSVISTLTNLKVPLPDTSTFKKSKFSESHGWGENQNKEYYLR